MQDARPDPDALLATVQQESERAKRGRLKIFFGYAAGVGKTYAMLQAAQRERGEGRDVVVGYVEPHNRPDTAALLTGFTQLELRNVPYRGVTLREFDLDAALARHPDLILVDELAHSNAEGSRHAKRWQDVEELLAAGINVYSTLNVQHLESLNDVIAQITGVTVQETLPDHVLEQANEIELIDLTPEELIDRLREGKIYLTAQAERALRHFFQRSNLTVLRELALRQSAERIHADVQSERQSHHAARIWPTHERLVVCVGPSPSSAKVIRSAKRMAAGLRAEWFAVTVETPQTLHSSDDSRERLASNLRLAEELGAESRVLSGTDAVDEIISFARAVNATKIVVGKPVQSRWLSLFAGSLVEDLLQRSGDIDVYIIRGVGEPQREKSRASAPQPASKAGYIAALITTAVACLIGVLLLRVHVSEANVVMVFLAAVLFTSARFGLGPGILASVAGVLAFDFFLVPPYLTLAITDAQYVLTFLVLLAVSLTTSHLTARLREQVEASRLRERRTEALYKLGKQLSGATGTDFLLLMAGQQLSQTFGGEWAVLLPDQHHQLQPRWTSRQAPVIDANLTAVAAWAYEHGQACGHGTETLPNVGALLVPLTGSQQTAGVLIGWDATAELWSIPDSRRQLETAAGLIALALERDRLTIEARQSALDAESERLRNAMLNSLSHDLRTPLAVITGASTSLLQRQDGPHTPSLDRDLLQTIADESDRLSRLIDSLLQITRIEAGGVQVQKEWHVPEEVLGAAVRRVQQQYPRHQFQLHLPADLPLVPMDAVLMEQVVYNLLENACRYSPCEAPIELSAQIAGQDLRIAIADRGPGLKADELKRVFEKFYRGSAVPSGDQRGAGLGLAICQAIITAHQGTIRAENRNGGGAVFSLTLPRGDNPPKINVPLE